MGKMISHVNEMTHKTIRLDDSIKFFQDVDQDFSVYVFKRIIGTNEINGAFW